MEDTGQITADTSAETVEIADSSPAQRDYEAEARQHGWTDKEAFKGDQSKWVDAETFIRRADEVMPFLKKQNDALKREMADLKQQFKKASAHFEKSEQRAYERALTDLQARHTEAVETGDTVTANRLNDELADIKADIKAGKPVAAPDPDQARRELNEWVEQNDWYVLDDAKRRYADLQADLMGPAAQWGGGQKDWLEQLSSRVAKKFADPKPSPVNGGGNRGAPAKGGKTYSDLPPEAKAACDKWMKSGLIKSREDYVKSYDFG